MPSLVSAGYTLAPEGGVFSQSFLPGAGPLLSGLALSYTSSDVLSLMLSLLVLFKQCSYSAADFDKV